MTYSIQDTADDGTKLTLNGEPIAWIEADRIMDVARLIILAERGESLPPMRGYEPLVPLSAPPGWSELGRVIAKRELRGET